jgi:hypothetical protein
MSKLKSSSTGIGAMPGSLPNVPHARPAPPKIDNTPRDSGGMADGKTSGNFSLDGMTALPNNAGASGTADVADQVAEQFGTLNTSTL